MSVTLDINVLTGVPEPTRSRWQPVRAGILNLFRYDEQTFAFHRGRLLIRGNNGSGKSMALEVLLLYVLDADLTPSRLSTFGGRDRSMYLWLLGHDTTGTRTSVRAYVWVEFGRRHLDGTSEFFTAGAMLEGARGGDVKAHYFTTAARLGVHLSVGGPGREPLSKNMLAALLAEQTTLGRPGRVHDDAKGHRTAVNGTLYRLSDKRFDALRATLRQLRRPKLSDKLDEAGLNLVLRDSLPPVADATVADLAEGFERLDRHAAAVTELEETIGHLATLRDAYRRYARVAAAARADAVAVAETAIGQVRDRATAAQTAFEAAQTALEQIEARREAIDGRLAEIRGRHEVLTGLDAYQQGQDLAPLRELVAELARTAALATETHRRLAWTAADDATAAERMAQVATARRDAADAARERAAVHSADAHTTTLDAALDAALADLSGRDVADVAALAGAVDDAHALLTRLFAELEPWESEVAGLSRLDGQVREKVAAVGVAQVETRRADGNVTTAEGELNDRLEDDRRTTLAWLDELTGWARSAVQLSAGQAPPLPWEPRIAADHARRWADEAAASRTQALVAEHGVLTEAAGGRSDAAAAAHRAAADLDALAALDGYRDTVTGWAGELTELPHGEAAPVWADVPADQTAARARAWADAAAAARTRTLLGEQSEVRRSLTQLEGRIDGLAAREEHLAAGGLPELDVPATRQASRDGRPGAALFLLVEFATGVDSAERLGVEAAAVGSGLADAWVSPDGQLLRADDGTPLLDTQLDVTGAAHPGTSLADVLVPAHDAAVPSDVVTALLARIGYAATATTAAGPGLTLGWDGTWRAGTLTGAHAVPEVTLIGAANREASRLASLAAVRAALAEARDAFEVLDAATPR